MFCESAAKNAFSLLVVEYVLSVAQEYVNYVSTSRLLTARSCAKGRLTGTVLVLVRTSSWSECDSTLARFPRSSVAWLPRTLIHPEIMVFGGMHPDVSKGTAKRTEQHHKVLLQKAALLIE